MKNPINETQIRKAISTVQEKIKFLRGDISGLQSLHNPIRRPNAGKVNATLLNLRTIEQKMDVIISFTLQQLKKEERIYTCFNCKDKENLLILKDLTKRDVLINIISNSDIGNLYDDHFNYHDYSSTETHNNEAKDQKDIMNLCADCFKGILLIIADSEEEILKFLYVCVDHPEIKSLFSKEDLYSMLVTAKSEYKWIELSDSIEKNIAHYEKIKSKMTEDDPRD